MELNGLYPQPCGATVVQLCKACGISEDSFARWNDPEKNAEFADRLTRAREKFAATTEVSIVNSLVKAARGVDFTKIKEEAHAEKIVEYDPKTGKKVSERTGELKTVKMYRETMYYPPDVKAAQFVLTNIAPERWKMKQDIAVEGSVRQYIVENQEQADKLKNIASHG